MNDSDEIEVEVVSEDEFASEAQYSRKGLGLIPVLTISAVAVILGAVGGAFGAQYVIPKADYSSLEADMRNAVKSVEVDTQKQVVGLRKDIKALERNMKIAVNDDGLEMSLNDINTRLKTVEDVPDVIIDPEAITALQKAQADGFVWPDVSAMEVQIADLQNTLATLTSEMEALKLKPFDITQNDSEAVSVMGLLENDSLSFPFNDLMKLAEAKVKPQSFFKRALNKHISVQNPNDPVVLVKQAATAFDNQDYAAAIKAFDKLPSDMRAAGSKWRQAVG